MAASVTAFVGVGNSSAPANNLETASFTPTGSNKVIYVLVGSGATSPSDPSSVKYASSSGTGGESLTRLDVVRTINVNVKTSVWKLVNPAASSGTIYVSYSGTDDERWIIAVAVQDAAGTEGTIAYAGSVSSSTSPSVTVTTTSGNLVLDFLSMLDGAGPAGGVTLTQGGSQTLVKKLDTDTPAGGSSTNISAFESAGISRRTASGTSTVMSWTLSRSSDWGIHSFQVNAAAAVIIPSRIKKNTIHPGWHPDRFGRHFRTRRDNTPAALSTITGTAAVQSGGDSISATGTETITGTAAVRSSGDLVSATAQPTITGTGAIQSAGDAESISLILSPLVASRRNKTPVHPGRGPYNFLHYKRSPRNTVNPVVPNVGTGTVQSGGDAFAVTATLTVTASAAIRATEDRASASATTTITASAAVQSQADRLAVSGSPIVSGSASIRDNGDQVAGSQNSSPITGAAAIQSGSDYFASTGAPIISGTGAIASQGDRAAAVVSLLVTGFGSVFSGGDLSAATGSLRVTGSAAVASGNDMPAGVGTLQITGTGQARTSSDATFFPPNTGTVFSNYEEFLEDD